METDDKPRPSERSADKDQDNFSIKERDQDRQIRQEKSKQKEKDRKKHIINWGWMFRIILVTFVISFVLSYLSESVLDDVHIVIASLVLVLFIILGVFFDIIGTAVMAVEPKTFNSMAAKKVVGAKMALSLIAKASAVSNFCNDVIGDICGVISGTMCSVLAVKLAALFSINAFFTILTATALTASLTVGFKAMGKNLAIAFSDKIIYAVARVICIIVPERMLESKKKK